jgi:hypothetical protein
MEKEMKIINLEQVILYTTELYQQLKEYSGYSSYDWPDIRTTWVTTKILVLTYDQSLEL